MAEASHHTTDKLYEAPAGTQWRCPNCVMTDTDPCTHTQENWEKEDK